MTTGTSGSSAIRYPEATVTSQDMPRITWLPVQTRPLLGRVDFGMRSGRGQLHVFFEDFDQAKGVERDRPCRRDRTRRRAFPTDSGRLTQECTRPIHISSRSTASCSSPGDFGGDRARPVRRRSISDRMGPGGDAAAGRPRPSTRPWSSTAIELVDVRDRRRPRPRSQSVHVARTGARSDPWVAHARNPVKTDARSARPGGTPFVVDGVLYRPGQDSMVGRTAVESSSIGSTP